MTIVRRLEMTRDTINCACIKFIIFIIIFGFLGVTASAQSLQPVIFDTSTNTITLQNLEFNESDLLPPGSRVTVQKINLSRPTEDLRIEFNNVQILLPHSEPVSIDGYLKNHSLMTHISIPRINLRDLFLCLPVGHPLRGAGGVLTDFSMDVTGPLDALKISARGRLRRVQYDRFFLKEAEFSMEMASRKFDGQVRWTGNISLGDAFVVFKSAANKAVIKVQSIGLFFKDSLLTDFSVDINQARLISPNLTAVLLYAKSYQGVVDANIYSADVGIQTILKFFPDNDALKKISGTINQLDVYVRGDDCEPQVAGSFRVNRIYNDDFSFLDAPGVFGLDLKWINDQLKLDGEIILNGGKILGPNAVALSLDSGLMLFEGDPGNPNLDFIAHTVVEGVKINVGFKGTMTQPDLKLSSDPSKSKDMLLIMLVTGRAWQSVETSLTQSVINPDLASDFVDYFIFGGSGAKMAQQFGIRNVSLKLGDEVRGINFKKDVSDRAFISYGVEQTQLTGQEAVMTQKLGGEYKFSDTVSLSAEKEIKQEEKVPQSQDKQPLADDKIILKYKKGF